ncbi:hypothetical protein GCM10009759_54820 [Kitasatospora saccharophila]|uniref:Uncharacterized protein n=1 Tax=Kitasatospora saccharophila TaxID=407973 RepID=A0ABN2XIP1_9ACTN
MLSRCGLVGPPSAGTADVSLLGTDGAAGKFAGSTDAVAGGSTGAVGRLSYGRMTSAKEFETSNSRKIVSPVTDRAANARAAIRRRGAPMPRPALSRAPGRRQDGAP